MLSHYRCAKCGATFTIASGDHFASSLITMGVLGALVAVPFVPKLLPALPVALAFGIAAVGAAGALFQLVRAVRYGAGWRAHPKA